MSYYADGVDAPLRTMVQIVRIIKDCKHRFPECQRAFEDPFGTELDRTDALFDLGPLFATAIARVPEPSPAPKTEFESAQLVRDLLARMEVEVRDVDREFVLRYAAVLQACSADRDTQLGMLGSVQRYDIERFDGDGAGEFDRRLESTSAAIRERAAQIESRWPKSTCEKAETLGKQLARAYWHKVRPFAGDDWQQVKARKDGLRSSHVWEMAYTLAAEHDPAVATRLNDFYRKLEDSTATPVKH